ncbi:hypothetical protein SAMN02745163_00560 [Clostridium cavendishii DSM 21758]|uniref:SpaA-like prealbumin fold domain-containing protein n=1 Tax=Clostridium cavendishii DSM 21758 TaxID=1121302 RepID=A0A1M6CUY7_9CLOT|nr:prealbumin-like fold domain-containing protein [Clostridium cavendishii]SHI64837.1 hypothetical protein SAMN02745163_00560 [Clostridium cavendishii DSM 21758]
MSFSVNDLYDFNYGDEANSVLDLCDQVHGDSYDDKPCHKPEPKCCKPEPPCHEPESKCCKPEPPCHEPESKCCKPEKPCPKPIPKKGKILVKVKLNCSDGEALGGVRINLYRLCGCSPELVASKRTDSHGKVEFKCLEDGDYRVIEIIDKCFFEKPEYYPWNEICIDGCNKHGEILIINKLKKIEKPCCKHEECGCRNFDNCCGNFNGCGCGDFNGCGCGFGGNNFCDSWLILLLLFGFCW